MPLIIQPYDEEIFPTIDNLYLDMNGIIHNCTHANNQDSLTVISNEKDVVLKVFRYIDRLFNMVKPKKNFFLGVDGVAPRAKMNQQRQRRFRSALEREKMYYEEKEKGDVPELDKVFDSNCITPGTDFMRRIDLHLQFFIKKKISEDENWKKCDVIYSGYDVPGEGEHKIMSFIRNRKTNLQLPNETHCLYGLDADLIMLSLASHEPYFILLREDVFGRYKGDDKDRPMFEDFELLHISVLRDYLEFEFQEGVEYKNYEFNLERVIDDFVMLCFLCGNDFLPHMPTLDIRYGAIEELIKVYKRTVPYLDGYLTNNGEIIFERAEQYINEVAKIESRMLVKKLNAINKKKKRGRGGRGRGSYMNFVEPPMSIPEINPKINVSKEIFNELKETEEMDQKIEKMRKNFEEDKVQGANGAYSILKSMNDDSTNLNHHNNNNYKRKKPVDHYDISSKTKKDKMYNDFYESMNIGDDDETIISTEMKGRAKYSTSDYHSVFDFDNWKRDYYKRKMKINLDKDHEKMRAFLTSYIEGMIWNYTYYYNGCCSWKWFYPYHYSPLTSEFKDMAEIAKGIKFELSKPFRPFQQLLSVLPPKSSTLLPQPYRWLMTSNKSPMHSSYPKHFEIDKEGTRYEWEGVVIIPFLDENVLLEAEALVNYDDVPDKEKLRNLDGKERLYQFNPNFTEDVKSSIPGISDVKGGNFSTDSHELKEERFFPKILPGTVLPGEKGIHTFPSLKIMKNIQAETRNIGVKVFDYPARNPTTVIILEKTDIPNEQKIRSLVGKTVHIGYPIPREGKISSISTLHHSYYSNRRCKRHSRDEKDQFVSSSKYHTRVLLSRFGLDVGKVDVLVYVRLFKRLRMFNDGKVGKEYSTENSEYPFPYQLILKNYNPLLDKKFLGMKKFDNRDWRLRQKVVCIGEKYFGGCGEISKIDRGKVSVSLNLGLKERIQYPQELKQLVDVQWYRLNEIAKITGLSHRTVGMVTSSITIRTMSKKKNIGLRLRSNRSRKRVVGYAKCQMDDQANDKSYFLNFCVKDKPPKKSMFAVGNLFNWQFTENAIELILEYKKQYPIVFEVLENLTEGKFDLKYSDFFPHAEREGNVELAEIENWITSQDFFKYPFLSCDSYVLNNDLIQQLEDVYLTLEDKKREEIVYEVPGNKMEFLYNPMNHLPKGTNFCKGISVGHEVVYIKPYGLVQFGLRGIVTGIKGSEIRVLFEKEFMGGSLERDVLKTHRCAIVHKTTLIDLSVRNKFRSKRNREYQRKNYSKQFDNGKRFEHKEKRFEHKEKRNRNEKYGMKKKKKQDQSKRGGIQSNLYKYNKIQRQRKKRPKKINVVDSSELEKQFFGESSGGDYDQSKTENQGNFNQNYQNQGNFNQNYQQGMMYGRQNFQSPLPPLGNFNDSNTQNNPYYSSYMYPPNPQQQYYPQQQQQPKEREINKKQDIYQPREQAMNYGQGNHTSPYPQDQNNYYNNFTRKFPDYSKNVVDVKYDGKSPKTSPPTPLDGSLFFKQMVVQEKKKFYTTGYISDKIGMEKFGEMKEKGKISDGRLVLENESEDTDDDSSSSGTD